MKEIENIYLYCNVFFVFVFSFWSGLRNTYNALEPFKDQKRSHVVIWDWIQGFGSCHIYNKHRRVSAFIIDETIIQIGDENFSGCGFVLNQFINRCLEYNISEERNMFVAEKFLRSLVSKYGRHTVYTDGGTWYPPQAYTFLHLKHKLHSPSFREESYREGNTVFQR